MLFVINYKITQDKYLYMIFKNFKNARENCYVNYTYCHVRVLSTKNINKKCEPQ